MQHARECMRAVTSESHAQHKTQDLEIWNTADASCLGMLTNIKLSSYQVRGFKGIGALSELQYQSS